MMNAEELFATGMVGKVEYDEIEDSYKLVQPALCFDLCQAFWEDYEGKKVKVTVEVLE